MNTLLAESKEQERRRLLTDLYVVETSYSVARRLQKWAVASSLAQEAARIARLLELTEGREGE